MTNKCTATKFVSVIFVTALLLFLCYSYRSPFKLLLIV